ncbi:MAG: GH1 family beta-glucosidase [Daejeonella sp.]|uniref:GH1 family beta-glucosidase n=1 Tax=Daejeonella sp. TaxID=2805397 RepID=UPI002732EDE3|nr:GH1 family beta-glucosidase [Daejeonella sp.]MDP3466904.1 GH1 family beta-glucosidase [Daejeonella sp.]
MVKRADFDKDFVWGVAASAFQTEGAAEADGKGLSIWDEFSRKKGKIYKGHSAGISCDFYNQYTPDLALMKSMHINNFRFSFSWSRIFPNGAGKVNEKGVDFYDRVIDLCLELGIKPWVTLYHWDLPLALQQKMGWVNRDIVDYFSDYVVFCIKHFGDRVKHWMILNEPMVYTGAGYFLGIHAPGKRGVDNFIPAIHHSALSQARGIRIAQSLRNDLEVGTTFSCSAIHPHTASVKDLNAAKRVNALVNRLFVEPLNGMGYPMQDLPFLRKIEKYMQQGDEIALHAEPDFIGIQNYTREVVKHSYFTPYINSSLVNAKNRVDEVTEMDWEIYPQAMHEMLHQFSKYNFKKLYVTENGAAFPDTVENGNVNDPKRISYLQANIAEILKAKKEGVNVEGYFVWSFTDNFEWAEGYRPRFGLVHVDYETQKRIVKASGHWYSNFLADL